MRRKVVPMFFVRTAKPRREHAIFTHAIQHAIGADDCRVDRAGKDQHAHNHHKALEQQLEVVRAGHVHGQAADQVAEICWPHAVGNDHDGKERDQRREQKAIEENDHSGRSQILELGRLDFTIHLGQGLFAAHCQHGMSKAHQHDNERQMRKPGTVEPAKEVAIQLACWTVTGAGGRWKPVSAAA